MFFFFKQKTAYEMRISDWSSDVCSSDLQTHDIPATIAELAKLLDLSADEVARINEDAAVKAGFQPLQIAHDLDWSQFAAINVRLTDFPGIQPNRGYARVYPDGPAVAHLLGHVGARSEGRRVGKGGVSQCIS